MKDLEQFAGKRMPYKESDDYVARLISECADNAVNGKRVARKAPVVRMVWQMASVAAVLALAVVLFVNLSKDSDYDRYLSSPALSEVLSQMSDEDLMCVSYYEVDEIPEYDE